jgi:hypothetical protein
MFLVALAGASALAGFVFGVLFGRRNTQKVEKAVAEVNKVLPKS